jgi:ATP-dependent Clp protease adaptor protein ClpS
MTSIRNDTSTKQWQETDVLTSVEEPCNLIVWNDEVNTFEWVIDTLMEICGHSHEQAEQCAYIIHFQGKYAVRKEVTMN